MSVISREDAFLVFSKWQAEGSMLLCVTKLDSDPPMELVGRIVELAATGVTLGSESGQTVVFTIPSNVEFGYAEPRDSPDLFKGGVAVLVMITFSADRSNDETVTFFELNPSS